MEYMKIKKDEQIKLESNIELRKKKVKNDVKRVLDIQIKEKNSKKQIL